MNIEENDKKAASDRKWNFAPLAWALPILGPGMGCFLYLLLSLFFESIYPPFFSIKYVDVFFKWIFVFAPLIVSPIISIFFIIRCFAYSNKYENTIKHGLGGLILILFLAIVGYIAYSGLHDRDVRYANQAAATAVKNAYNLSTIYFKDHSVGELTLPILYQYGYKKSDKVTLTIVDGKRDSLKLQSEHKDGTEVYLVEGSGSF